MKMLLAVTASLSLAACQQAAPPANDSSQGPATNAADSMDSSDATAALSSAEDAQIAAINAHDAAAASSVYADNAMFFDAGSPPVEGAANISAAFQQMMADENVAIDFRSRSRMVSQDGQMAYSTADYDYTSTNTETGQAEPTSGLNLTVWQRQDDGSWKIVADYNAPTAPQ